MAVYAIGDLHLSGNCNKPMNVFGEHWTDHNEKIKKSWIKIVKEEDAILIPGDISWAMTLKEAMIDLKWIESLPGTKYLIKGNHDYWWGSITKLNSLFNRMHFIQNNFFTYEQYAICGTRGWICPNDYNFTDHDKKIYLREVSRLERSLKAAKQAGYKNIIVMLHYPPTNDKLEPSLFTQTLEKYNVQNVIYAHLHDEASHNFALKGNYRGINYKLVSCDYINFEVVKVL